MPAMDQVTIDDMVKAYPQSVRLTEVKIRDRGEVKKLDAGDLLLRAGDRVLLEVDGEQLRSRITHDACEELNLSAGQNVFVLIKSVALESTLLG